MEEVFAGVEHTGALVMDIEGSVLQVSSSSSEYNRSLQVAADGAPARALQATGELESGSEEVGRIVYSMLQDANAIGHAQKAGADAFQRLSSAPPARCCAPGCRPDGRAAARSHLLGLRVHGGHRR